MASNNTYTLKVEQNEITEEYYVILPEQLLKKLNWKPGDTISWHIKKDGSIFVKKAE
ncbi:AbrB/MazE/SpoVT family DNA-binding domain-containing protein [bacterium]|nr:AbrB/MazE/SpoVT family DNA-binding domain-containing protein [bacterium]